MTDNRLKAQIDFLSTHLADETRRVLVEYLSKMGNLGEDVLGQSIALANLSHHCAMTLFLFSENKQMWDEMVALLISQIKDYGDDLIFNDESYLNFNKETNEDE